MRTVVGLAMTNSFPLDRQSRCAFLGPRSKIRVYVNAIYCTMVLVVHPRPPVGAARLVIDVLDPFAELRVGELPRRGDMPVPLIEGGPGDLEQLTRPLHRVVTDLRDLCGDS